MNSNRSMLARAALLLRLAIIGLLPLVAAAQSACVLPPSGLIAWWQGEGNGSDSAGTNNAYALPNITFTEGIVGRAFAIDPQNYPLGAYTGVRIADQPCYVLTNSLSIEGWVRPRGVGYVIFYRGDNRSGLDPYGMGMGGNNVVGFWITDAIGNNAGVSAPLVYNQWWHVAGTLDGASGKLSLYTNGALAAQITTAIRPFGSLIPQCSPGIGIGNVNDGFNNFPFHGDIDELSLYNRALSATEIEAIYQAGSEGKCMEPVIETQPLSQVGYLGRSVTFSVTAGGLGPFSYQWQKDNVPIAGATESSLVLINLQLNNAGNYSVVVTNSFGSTTSSNAYLTVNSAGVSLALYSGITIDGVVGITYGIQSSTNLSNTNGWRGVANITLSLPTQLWIDLQPANQPQRYYRVVPGPISIP